MATPSRFIERIIGTQPGHIQPIPLHVMESACRLVYKHQAMEGADVIGALPLTPEDLAEAQELHMRILSGALDWEAALDVLSWAHHGYGFKDAAGKVSAAIVREKLGLLGGKEPIVLPPPTTPTEETEP